MLRFIDDAATLMPALRLARPDDLPAIKDLHIASLRALGTACYDRDQIEGLLADVETADPALVEDGTFAVAIIGGQIAATGAWTLRRPAYEDKLNHTADACERVATIRAIFTAPSFARRGLGRQMMAWAVSQAIAKGRPTRLELCATMVGIGLYRRFGFAVTERADLDLSNGARFPAVRMARPVQRDALAA